MIAFPEWEDIDTGEHPGSGHGVPCTTFSRIFMATARAVLTLIASWEVLCVSIHIEAISSCRLPYTHKLARLFRTPQHGGQRAHDPRIVALGTNQLRWLCPDKHLPAYCGSYRMHLP